MPDVLTQKEVDALLRGPGGGASASSAVEVVPYNFVRPSRVSKERQATLEAVFARFAAALQGLLTSRLRAPTDVGVSSVEQLMFTEFVLSLPSPCSTFVFRTHDRTQSQGVIDLGSELGFLIVDRLFGGAGDTAMPRRAHTTLEQAVIRGISERALGLLREAWNDHVPMQPEIASFESNPAMLQFAGREDNVLVANLTVRASESLSAFLTVCLPMAVFESFLQEQAASRSASGPDQGAEHAAQRATIGAALQKASVELRARLPQITLTTRALAALEPGQTILTGHPVDAPIEVHLNGRLHHLGTVGQSRRYVGVRLAQRATVSAPDRPQTAREGRVQ